MNRINSNSNRNIASGTAQVFLSESLALPFGLLSSAYLTRNLGAEDYGLFTITSILIIWVSILIAGIFAQATVNFVGKSGDWRPVATTSLQLNFAAGLTMALLIWLLAEPISIIFHEPKIAQYLRLFSPQPIITSLVSVHRNTLIGTGRFRERAIAGSVHWPIKLMLIVILVGLGLSVTGAILAYMGATLVELAIYRYYIQPSIYCRKPFPAKKLLRLAGPLFLFALCMRMIHRVDLFIVKALGQTPEEAGFFGAAQNLAIVPGLLALSFSPLLLATLVRMTKEGLSREAHDLTRNSIRLVVAMIPFAGMAAGATYEIVVFVFGPEFVAAGSFFSWLIFSKVGFVLTSVCAVMMISAEKIMWTLYLGIPMLLITIVGLVAVVPDYGGEGAAMTTAVVTLMGTIFALLIANHLWRGSLPFTTIARSALLCTVAYYAGRCFHADGLLLVFKLATIVIMIPGGFYLLGEFSSKEKERIGICLKNVIFHRKHDFPVV